MPENPDHALPLPTRRRTLLWAAAAPLLLARAALPGPAVASASPAPVTSASGADPQFAKLEESHRRRLGVYALDTGSGKEIGYRAAERFPFCSTFKALLAGATLARDASTPGLLATRIVYARQDLASYSPVTEKHVGAGMTVSELCAAAVQYSDNTAANLLLHQLGGPPALTAYARSLGNETFRLDRYETALNTAIPGDMRDTVTPADMAGTLRAMVLGNALPPAARDQLKTWLLGNKTGDHRIRAGTPAGWPVGDKTGTGDYGATNDIAVIWPPQRAPFILAVYSASLDKHAKTDDSLVAEATRVAIALLA
jgi:beta-lactamase class A